MEATKKVIFTNQRAIDKDVLHADHDLKTINKFLDTIKPLAGLLTKEQYHAVVTGHEQVNFAALNEIVFEHALNERPNLKALSGEISKEELIKIADIQQFIKKYIHNADTPNTIEGLVQAWFLNSQPEYWTISKGKAVLISGLKEKIVLKYTWYAESEIELQRLELCNQILKIKKELRDISEVGEKFDMEQNVVLVCNDGEIADPDVILSGGEPYRAETGVHPVRHREASPSPIPHANDGQKEYQAALKKAAAAVNMSRSSR